MSVNYSAGLSPYEDKGVCGLPEIIDDPDEIEEKISLLKDLIISSSLVTVHCGAGISTSCGIPDFRGPKGVWTLELKSEVKKEDDHSKSVSANQEKTTDRCISFEDSKPSFTHRALAKLSSSGYIHHIISQNVDGLFLKTGLERRFISELHGNFFLDECDLCKTRFIRMTSSPTMGLKLSSHRCQRPSRPCRGYLRDTILDWEDNLPEQELSRAQEYSRQTDLSICLGTSLQIVPAAQLPFWCKKNKQKNCKVVIINLQPTKFDHKADLVIHDYVDIVMKKLCGLLNIDVPEYSPERDLTLSEKKKSRVWE